MKLLLIFPVFFSFALAQDVGVGAQPNTDRQPSIADTATSEITSSPLSWLNVGSNMIKDSSDKNIWNTALQFGNNAAQVATSLGSLIVESGSDYVKQGLRIATPLGASGIDQGPSLTTQVLGLARTIPGLDFLSEIGKTAVNLGTNAVNGANTFEDEKLSFISNLSQMGTNALSSIVNGQTSLGQDMITSGNHAIKSVIDTGFDEGELTSSSMNAGREGSVSTRNILRFPPR